MEHSIQILNYEDQDIEFDLYHKGLMINATEMAKPFGKKVNHILENDGVKLFLDECLNNRNSGYLNIGCLEDIVIAKQKSGTWMHRVLALKFAAWLSPAFELWVYQTVDQILFASYKRMEQGLKESAERQNRIGSPKSKLKSSEVYLELELLELEERQAAYRRGRDKKISWNSSGILFELGTMRREVDERMYWCLSIHLFSLSKISGTFQSLASQPDIKTSLLYGCVCLSLKNTPLL